jgi:hypothetical protein
MMANEFETSIIRELSYFLGLQIKQLKNGIFVSQDKYIKGMLKKFGMIDRRPLVYQWEQMAIWIVMQVATWLIKSCIDL